MYFERFINKVTILYIKNEHENILLKKMQVHIKIKNVLA